MEEYTITDELMTAFAQKLWSEEKSKATVEKYLRDVAVFRAFLGSRRIEKSLTLAYKEALRERYAPESVNSMLASLHAFLRFAGVESCCVRRIRVQKTIYCPENKELTKQEYLSLVRTAERKKNERLALLLQAICATGVRVSEIRYFTVEGVREGEIEVSCKGKTRTVFIVAQLKRKLLRYAKNHRIFSGMIFVTKNGKAMDRSNIWHEMKALCAQAGVSAEKVFPHNLRHLFARVFYSMEKDLVKLADILGHSSINTTRIYTVTTGAEHRRKLENMRLIL